MKNELGTEFLELMQEKISILIQEENERHEAQLSQRAVCHAKLLKILVQQGSHAI